MDIKESDIFSQSLSKIRHPWEIARVEVVEKLLQPVMRKASASDSILDIGCGDAFILNRLAQKWPSFKYVGVDPALTVERIDTLKKNYPLINLSFHADSSKPGVLANPPFLTLLLDVLEHVSDDQSVLNEAAGVIKKDGYLLITAPAFQKLYNNHDRWLGHYRRYTRSGLTAKIEQAGLKPVFSAYVFSSLVIFRLVSKVAERLHWTDQRPHQGIGHWDYGKTAGRLVSKMLYANACGDLWLEKFKLPHFGLSVVILCQK
jgi:2-polyprenyl-3-methyl-5-hydroxy-6-metoxy-1,4-benzoquinol methylase